MAAFFTFRDLRDTTKELLNWTMESDEGVHLHRRSSIEQLQQLHKEIESLTEDANFLISFFGSSFQSDALHSILQHIRDAARKAKGMLPPRREELVADDEELCGQVRRVREDVISSISERINNMFCEMVTIEESVGIPCSSSLIYISLIAADSDLSYADKPLILFHVDNPFILSHADNPISRRAGLIGVGDVFAELKRLVDKSSSTELRVVSLVGMGGIGKTSVARAFYEDTFTLEQFEIHGWVTVSQDFSPRDILKRLMVSMQPFITEPKKRDESIENYLHKNLKGRRFFIVIDDVWSVDALRFLMRTFPDDGNGSRILLTTRLKEVADQVEPMPNHIISMKFLNQWASHYLLRKLLRPQWNPELYHYVRGISYRCKGLPLAIVLVGGILRGLGKSLSDWEHFWAQFEGTIDFSLDELVDRILVMSYSHLDDDLKPFLLYMGAFPEDHEIKVSRLSKQLIAQDFVQKPSASSSYGEVVEECLDKLVGRSLVSVQKRKSAGGIKIVSLHDMVRSFCLKKGEEEGFIHIVTGNDSAQDLKEKRYKSPTI